MKSNKMKAALEKLVCEAQFEELDLVAYRPEWHHKGSKILMRIRLGDPIPKGVILGKDTHFTITKANAERRTH